MGHIKIGQHNVLYCSQVVSHCLAGEGLGATEDRLLLLVQLSAASTSRKVAKR